MDYEKYYQAFKSLNISVDPLPQNYTPEDFGRRLMSLSQTEQDVSYSASTEYVKSPLKNSDTHEELGKDYGSIA